MSMSRYNYPLPVTHMDLSVTATFNGPALPWGQQSTFSFETATYKNGGMHWVYSPMQSLVDDFPWPAKQFEIVVEGDAK